MSAWEICLLIQVVFTVALAAHWRTQSNAAQRRASRLEYALRVVRLNLDADQEWLLREIAIALGDNGVKLPRELPERTAKMSYRDEEVARLHARVNQLEEKLAKVSSATPSRPPIWFQITVGAALLLMSWPIALAFKFCQPVSSKPSCVYDYCYTEPRTDGVMLIGHTSWWDPNDKFLSKHATLVEAVQAAALLHCPMMEK